MKQLPDERSADAGYRPVDNLKVAEEPDVRRCYATDGQRHGTNSATCTGRDRLGSPCRDDAFFEARRDMHPLRIVRDHDRTRRIERISTGFTSNDVQVMMVMQSFGGCRADPAGELEGHR